MSLPVFNCPKFRSQSDLQLLLQVFKKKENPSNYTNKKNHIKIKLASDKT